MQQQLNKINWSRLVSNSIWFLVFPVVFMTCEDGKDLVPLREWQLTWEDNFDGPAGQAPDASKWVYDIGRGPGGDGWGNNELQYYTDRPENVALDGDGNLVITALRESFAGAPYTSARIKTKGKFDQTYGRWEARIKMPWGPGLWPAFWMLGSNIDQVQWPRCGEIDIMEYRGQEPNIVHGSVHGPGYSGGSPITKSFSFEDKRFDTDFHIFSIEWGEDYINYFVDGVAYQQITLDDVEALALLQKDGEEFQVEWVFDTPFFILLNVAVGGNYVGFPAQETTFPQQMIVDWVRVYSEKR